MLASSRQRLRAERGAATLELTGVMTVASILVLALLAAVVPQAPVLGQTYAYWICKVTTLGQGDCGGPTSPEDHLPPEPCVVQSDGVESNMKVAVLVFTTEEGKRVLVEKLSDGTYRVTVSDSGGVGLETGVGGGLSVTVNDTTVGGNAQAQVGASLDITAGDVYYADQDSIGDLMAAIQQDQLLDATAGDSGPIRWITDGATSVLGVDHDLPEPDETYAEGGISLNASAEATGGTTSAAAGVEAGQVLGVRKSKNGETTVYVTTTVSGEAGLQSLGYDTAGDPQFQGGGLEGELQVMTAVTFDSSGNMTEVQASAVAAGGSSGLATALFGGSGDASTSNSGSSATVWQSTLPIKTDDDQRVASNFLIAQGVSSLGGWVNPLVGTAAAVGGIPASLDFFDAARDRGYTTQQSYDTDSNTVFALDAAGKLGLELGIQADVSTDSMSSTEARYWDGTQWQTWQGCA